MAGAHALKRRLAAELGAPLDGGADKWRSGKLGVPCGDNGAAAAARTAAVTLARHGGRMPVERREELERVVWEAIRSDGEGEEEEDGNDNGGGSGKEGGEETKPPPALPPKEVLAAKLVAASSASGILVRRDAQRLCRALGVTLKLEEEEEEESEGEDANDGNDDESSRLSSSKRRRRPRGAAAAPSLLSSLPGRRTGGGHRSHGLAVVRALASSSSAGKDDENGNGIEPALDALAARFRHAFVAAVAPRFLPPGWSVDSPLGRRAHGPYSAVVRAEEEARERSAAEARERRGRGRRGKGEEARGGEEGVAFAF